MFRVCARSKQLNGKYLYQLFESTILNKTLKKQISIKKVLKQYPSVAKEKQQK